MGHNACREAQSVLLSPTPLWLTSQQLHRRRLLQRNAVLRPIPLSSTQRLTCILVLAAAGALAGCHDTAAPTQLPRIRPVGRPGLSSVETGIAGIAEGQVIVRFRSGADHDAVEQDHGAQHESTLLLPRTE